MEPKKTISVFGKPYVWQGTFENPDELKTIKNNWKKIGHSVVVKGKNLYASQFKTRNW